MNINNFKSRVFSGLFVVAVVSVVSYTMGASNTAPKSNPEVVFEPKPVFQCEKIGNLGNSEAWRCTDSERDVTCYNLRKADPLSCLPNQWLNYPASIGNVNDPIAQ